MIERSGWPLRCVESRRVGTEIDGKRASIDQLPAWMSGIRVPEKVASGSRDLPLVPLWPGFLVDTAFWGGAAFLVWSVPGFVRRGVRRRRGRCVRCGYELKGLAVCPECGGAA
jgi:hypothetical protein